jgi:hypothetical protein
LVLDQGAENGVPPRKPHSVSRSNSRDQGVDGIPGMRGLHPGEDEPGGVVLIAAARVGLDGQQLARLLERHGSLR